MDDVKTVKDPVQGNSGELVDLVVIARSFLTLVKQRKYTSNAFALCHQNRSMNCLLVRLFVDGMGGTNDVNPFDRDLSTHATVRKRGFWRRCILLLGKKKKIYASKSPHSTRFVRVNWTFRGVFSNKPMGLFGQTTLSASSLIRSLTENHALTSPTSSLGTFTRPHDFRRRVQTTGQP
jgi:hypothetical protein